MLLFRAGENRRMGVPLGLVARLEDIPREKIEMSCGAPVTQYRGKLMPLIAIDGGIDQQKPTQPLLVFAEGDRTMGLMVDEIIDVVEDRLDIELAGARAGPAGHGGDRRPGHRRAGYRLLADAGLAGLVPRRAAPGRSPPDRSTSCWSTTATSSAS